MTKLKAPRFLDVIDAVSQAGAARVSEIMEKTGCDYTPTRRVLDLLADEGLIIKVMRGTRTFEYTPTDDVSPDAVEAFAIVDVVNEQERIVEEITSPPDEYEDVVEEVVPRNFGEREDDYPREWLNAGRKSFEATEDDLNIWIIRRRGVKVGEVAELVFGDKVCYQVVSPWEPKTFDRVSAAIASLGRR